MFEFETFIVILLSKLQRGLVDSSLIVKSFII